VASKMFSLRLKKGLTAGVACRQTRNTLGVPRPRSSLGRPASPQSLTSVSPGTSRIMVYSARCKHLDATAMPSKSTTLGQALKNRMSAIVLVFVNEVRFSRMNRRFRVAGSFAANRLPRGNRTQLQPTMWKANVSTASQLANHNRPV